MKRLKLMVDLSAALGETWHNVISTYAERTGDPLVLVNEVEEADGLLVVADNTEVIPPAMMINGLPDLPVFLINPKTKEMTEVSNIKLGLQESPRIVKEILDATR